MSSRRIFFKQSALVSSGALLLPNALRWVDVQRKFRLCLNPSAIGVNLTNEELLTAARTYGFEAIVPQIYEMEKWTNAQFKGFSGAMKNYGVTWGAAGLPVDFRKSSNKFQKDLDQLSGMLPKLEKAGIERMSTWIMPMHDKLNYQANMAEHAARLRKIARLLSTFNMKLGLEYVGPKTLRESQEYPFVSSLKELKELISVIGERNVGVQLDAFHWYCAGENEKDLLSLNAEDIVTVDLNDAKAGRTRDEQLDWERELPGKTGLIDLKTFLGALAKIGYEGPVRAEPFNNTLNDMDNEAALKATSAAMQKALSLLD